MGLVNDTTGKERCVSHSEKLAQIGGLVLLYILGACVAAPSRVQVAEEATRESFVTIITEGCTSISAVSIESGLDSNTINIPSYNPFQKRRFFYVHPGNITADVTCTAGDYKGTTKVSLRNAMPGDVYRVCPTVTYKPPFSFFFTVDVLNGASTRCQADAEPVNPPPEM